MSKKNVNISEALNAYFKKMPCICETYGNGHINDTFVVGFSDKRYILQRIDTDIFRDYDGLMKNILGVTEHIRKKTAEAQGDVERCSLTVFPTLTGDKYFKDSEGNVWRAYPFVENTVALDKARNADDLYCGAKAFGKFQRQLADYPADDLTETIVNFHNTPWRYENLIKAVKEDPCGRLQGVLDEVAFVKAREEFCKTLEKAKKANKLPLRVTHNDTKLNNVLFDKISGEAICVIDLDTVMPGYSVNDFGDAIRFAANTAAEDETDLSKVKLDLELFEAFAKGFIEGCGGALTDTELKMLPVGAIMMTLECGMRFLTDHLEGDKYFKIHREGHNLDRARNQFALVADMEKKLDRMQEIITSETKQ